MKVFAIKIHGGVVSPSSLLIPLKEPTMKPPAIKITNGHHAVIAKLSS
jgi:hypothetical protein